MMRSLCELPMSSRGGRPVAIALLFSVLMASVAILAITLTVPRKGSGARA